MGSEGEIRVVFISGSIGRSRCLEGLFNRNWRRFNRDRRRFDRVLGLDRSSGFGRLVRAVIDYFGRFCRGSSRL